MVFGVVTGDQNNVSPVPGTVLAFVSHAGRASLEGKKQQCDE
jgi:hypothetical protein